MRCVRCGWARASPAAPAVRSWRGSGQEREDAVGIEDTVRLIGQEDVRKEKEEGGRGEEDRSLDAQKEK